MARYSLIVATQTSAGDPPAVPLAPLELLVSPLVPPLVDAAPDDVRVPLPPSVLESSLHATAASATTHATTLHIPKA